MTTPLELRFATALNDRQLLNHPFYQRWEAGELKREELTRYAEQYRYFEAMLPDFLARLSNELPNGVAKDFVDANLADEVNAPSHLELFEAFAAHYDATDAAVSPAMRQLLDAYETVLALGTTSSLAGLFAYENQGAAIADSKAAGLDANYEASDASLAFWREHGNVEASHAAWTVEALASLSPDLDVVEQGARLVGDAWWNFLDERELLNA